MEFNEIETVRVVFHAMTTLNSDSPKTLKANDKEPELTYKMYHLRTFNNKSE